MRLIQNILIVTTFVLKSHLYSLTVEKLFKRINRYSNIEYNYQILMINVNRQESLSINVLYFRFVIKVIHIDDIIR